MAWPVFMVSGPAPDGPSRNDTRVFQQPAKGRYWSLLKSILGCDRGGEFDCVRANDAALAQVPITGSLAWSFTHFYPA